MSEYLTNCRKWQNKTGRSASIGFTDQLIDKVAELEDRLEKEQKSKSELIARSAYLENQMSTAADFIAELQFKNMWLGAHSRLRLPEMLTQYQIAAAEKDIDELIEKINKEFSSAIIGRTERQKGITDEAYLMSLTKSINLLKGIAQ